LPHCAFGDEQLIAAAPFCAHKQSVWGRIWREWHVERGKSRESQVAIDCYSFEAIAATFFCQP
jgi:hypothetical protein